MPDKENPGNVASGRGHLAPFASWTEQSFLERTRLGTAQNITATCPQRLTRKAVIRLKIGAFYVYVLHPPH